MAYNVYSLPDVKSVLYHPDVGTANLHLCGIGKIVVSAAGDLTSHTTTADGYVVVNRLKTTNGTIQIEDTVSGFKTICTGVSLQKAPDRTWDRTATNVSYTLLAATITEQ